MWRSATGRSESHDDVSPTAAEQPEEIRVLFAAAEHDRTDILQAAIEALRDLHLSEADVMDGEEMSQVLSVQRASDGATPLHVAGLNGNVDVVRALLRAGALPHLTANGPFGGKTAYEAATARCQEAFVQELHQQVALGGLSRLGPLLDAGVSPDARDGSAAADTALHWAASFGNLGAAMLLLDRGADVNAVNAEGATPLHEARRAGHAQVAELLLVQGADPDAVGTGGSFAGKTPAQMTPTPASQSPARPQLSTVEEDDIQPAEQGHTGSRASHEDSNGGRGQEGEHPDSPVARGEAGPLIDPPEAEPVFASLGHGDMVLPLLWPPPKSCLAVGGCDCVIPLHVTVVLPRDCGVDCLAWKMLAAQLRSKGVSAQASRLRSPPASSQASFIVLAICPQFMARASQAYTLSLGAQSIRVTGADLAGLMYGTDTLCQVLRLYSSPVTVLSSVTLRREVFGLRLPAVCIRDQPDVTTRAAVVDMRFPRVPSLPSLMRQVERLARWRFNRLHLVLDRATATWLAEQTGDPPLLPQAQEGIPPTPAKQVKKNKDKGAKPAEPEKPVDASSAGLPGSRWGWGQLGALEAHCRGCCIQLVLGWRLVPGDENREAWRSGLQVLTSLARQSSCTELYVAFSRGVQILSDEEAAEHRPGLALSKCLSNVVVACPQDSIVLAGLSRACLASLQSAPYLPANCAFTVPPDGLHPACFRDGLISESPEAVSDMLGPVQLGYIEGGARDDFGSAALSICQSVASVQEAVLAACQAGCGVQVSSRPTSNPWYPSVLEEALLLLSGALAWGLHKTSAALAIHTRQGAADTSAQPTTPAGPPDLSRIVGHHLLGQTDLNEQALHQVRWVLDVLLWLPRRGGSVVSVGGGAPGGGMVAADMGSADSLTWALHCIQPNQRLYVRFSEATREALKILHGQYTRIISGPTPLGAPRDPSPRQDAGKTDPPGGKQGRAGRGKASQPDPAGTKLNLVEDLLLYVRLLKLSCRLLQTVDHHARAHLGASADPPAHHRGGTQRMASSDSIPSLLHDGGDGAAALVCEGALDKLLSQLPPGVRSNTANSMLNAYGQLARRWVQNHDPAGLPRLQSSLHALLSTLTFDLANFDVDQLCGEAVGPSNR